MPVAALDQYERALAQFDPLVVHDGHARTEDDEQPLVRTSGPVFGAAFGVPWFKRHLSGCTRPGDSVNVLKPRALFQSVTAATACFGRYPRTP
jgi:hypothetical protein